MTKKSEEYLEKVKLLKNSKASGKIVLGGPNRHERRRLKKLAEQERKALLRFKKEEQLKKENEAKIGKLLDLASDFEKVQEKILKGKENGSEETEKNS